MKKLLILVCASIVGVQLLAQETAKVDELGKAPREDVKQESAVWPAFFALCEFPASPDLVGLRVTVPFSTRQENVTGLDLGLWGRALYFEGLQLNIIRNEAKDSCAGVQLGLYNTIGRGDMFAVQGGLWNEALSVTGAQVGLVNIAGDVKGFQLGLINRCETMYGYQLGIINVIRDAEMQFCPIFNVGF